MARYLLKAKKALLGDDLKVVEKAAVVVENDTIVFAGTQDEAAKKYPDCIPFDLRDQLLMPGMIDSHSHTSLDARVLGHLEMMNDPESELTIRAINNSRDDLMSGITTCRILGDKHYVDVAVRNAINAGLLTGPHLLVSGVGMRGIHGHGFVGVAHTGEQEFRKTCRENMLRRVDWLKVFVTGGTPPVGSDFIPSFISLEEIQTVTGEAKRMGIRTSAHCIGGEGLVNCVKGGIDVIDHAYCATDADLELIAKNDRTICLTPSVFMDLERNKANTPALTANIEKGRDKVIKVMQKIVTCGVKYAIGTDALHAHMPLEAKYAVELGASNYAALLGVTINSAKLCSVENKCGSIVVGKRADMIAVEGNPLEKIENLANVRFIMKNGIRYL